MSEINYRFPSRLAKPATQKEKTTTRYLFGEWWFWVLALLFLTEFFSPFIIATFGFSRVFNLFNELISAAIVGIGFAYMLLRDRIPAVVVVILGITIVWSLISMLDGQALAATAWGWWRLFKYPLIMVFAYLVPNWPKDFARWLVKFLIYLLIFEVGFQLIQYATGTPTGDNLAGTFGRNGVGQHTMLVFFTISITMGYWLATGDLKLLLLALAVGLVATTLNVSKFYPVGVVAIGTVALLIHIIRGGKIKQLFLYLIIFILALLILVALYNNFLVNVTGLRPLQEYLTVDAIQRYLFLDENVSATGAVRIGRGLSVTYAWDQIQRDATTTLFGYGLGSRTYSSILGFQGQTLQDDLYGGGSANTLGIWVQEFGTIGLIVFVVLTIWVSWKLLRAVKYMTDPYKATLTYGIISFTLLWLVWLFYHKPWDFGGMMMFYWITLGYLFREIYPRRTRRYERPNSIMGQNK